MRTVWVIEKASRPALSPQWLAEDDLEVLFWTTDLARALHFTERDLANRFASNRVTVPVRVIDKVEG